MQPFQRFKKSNTKNNLWMYILSLAKEQKICNEDIRGLIFEKFGFLPSVFSIIKVLYRLKSQNYIINERYKSKKAYKTTNKGLTELEKMKNFSQKLLKKL